jgi:sulfoxide reductase heme-binding subunit YedZ
VSANVPLIWTVAKAAGITAVLLSSLSVALGLLMGTGVGKKLGKVDLRTAHEALSLATLAAIGLHAVALLADPWLKPGLAGVLLPLQVSYRPAAVAIGIIAGYGLVALGLSYYARGRIGVARWRQLHRWTALFWVLSIAHGFTAGSDAGQSWYVISVAAVAAPAALLLAARMLRPRAARPAPGQPAPGRPRPEVASARP